MSGLCVCQRGRVDQEFHIISTGGWREESRADERETWPLASCSALMPEVF